MRKFFDVTHSQVIQVELDLPHLGIGELEVRLSCGEMGGPKPMNWAEASAIAKWSRTTRRNMTLFWTHERDVEAVAGDCGQFVLKPIPRDLRPRQRFPGLNQDG